MDLFWWMFYAICYMKEKYGRVRSRLCNRLLDDNTHTNHVEE